MAESQPESAQRTAQMATVWKVLRRRKVMIGIGALLSIAAVCVADILLMLQRLEARNASFQPPMTELERQRLLPPDPILEAAPKLEGLRYGQQVEIDSANLVPVEHDPSQAQGSLSRALMQRRQQLHAESDVRPIPSNR
mgnify:CR=1 FL=1